MTPLDLASPEAGPKPTKSLVARGSDLVAPAVQLARLDAVKLSSDDDFDTFAARSGYPEFSPASLEILQVNMGKLCNMTCRHCHVDAGPDRVEENMSRDTVDAVLEVLDRTGAHTVDITGGAPELNPHFTYFVEECVSRGKHVIDRCNLTVLLLPKLAGLPQWLADRGVEVVCSLPHHRARNTDAQRGDGTYAKSIRALEILNAVGYGQGDATKVLTLMTNPAGAFLAPDQAATEQQWKASLQRHHGVTFDRLIALNNMPISRFLEWLEDTSNLEAYMQKLLDSFNPAALSGVMCRNTISVGWDGWVYDCDFNQMLAMHATDRAGERLHIANFAEASAEERVIATARHCFGCTAGAGSSCGGATA
ncbi:MAG: arsenosugar biosynthesis radical SAM protein ArsS [Deltaproteobacteria bacterium]|nr:arsenosugar biosynthesis radical SAM protein ArsS [Deltaproteobacteria bacterium]